MNLSVLWFDLSTYVPGETEQVGDAKIKENQGKMATND